MASPSAVSEIAFARLLPTVKPYLSDEVSSTSKELLRGVVLNDFFARSAVS